jgi:hypothetical protein
VKIIHLIWLSDQWCDLWRALGLRVESFVTLQLAFDSPDALVWRLCQREELILVTGNRNADNADSLEPVIRTENQPTSLPVATLANPERISRDRHYAEIAAESLLGYLIRIDDFRGAGRIYVP